MKEILSRVDEDARDNVHSREFLLPLNDRGNYYYPNLFADNAEIAKMRGPTPINTEPPVVEVYQDGGRLFTYEIGSYKLIIDGKDVLLSGPFMPSILDFFVKHPNSDIHRQVIIAYLPRNHHAQGRQELAALGCRALADSIKRLNSLIRDGREIPEAIRYDRKNQTYTLKNPILPPQEHSDFDANY